MADDNNRFAKNIKKWSQIYVLNFKIGANFKQSIQKEKINGISYKKKKTIKNKQTNFASQNNCQRRDQVQSLLASYLKLIVCFCILFENAAVKKKQKNKKTV